MTFNSLAHDCDIVDREIHHDYSAAFYAVVFWQNPEAAFASCHLWRSVGAIASLGYSNLVCTDIKLYILLCVLTLGVASYFAVDAEVKRASAVSLHQTTGVSAVPVASVAALPLTGSGSYAAVDVSTGMPVVSPVLFTAPSNPLVSQ